MNLDIIFVNNYEENSIDKFKKDFERKIIFDDDDKLFCDELVFEYNIKKSLSNKNIRLQVNTLKETETKLEADHLSLLKRGFRNGIHRKNYKIIIIYDGSSEYYCNKLYKFLAKYERNLRRFIYIITLSAFGNKWVEETFSKEIKAEVSSKGVNKNKHIEMALECFDFQTYIDYLFTKRSEIELEDIIEEINQFSYDKKFDKNELINILSKGKKVSLWEKLFDEYSIDILEKEIDDIRKIRNVVMHNKEINDIQFEEYKKSAVKK